MHTYKKEKRATLPQYGKPKKVTLLMLVPLRGGGGKGLAIKKKKKNVFNF